MTSAGFEPTIPASQRQQTHALRPRGHWDRLCVLAYNRGILSYVGKQRHCCAYYIPCFGAIYGIFDTHIYIQQPRLWERGAANDVSSTNLVHMTQLDPVNDE